MPQRQILLPLETSLRLRIAILEHDLARLQAQLLQVSADQQHTQRVAYLLEAAQITLPVPLSQCGFDVERGCLTYEDTVNSGEEN